MRYRKQLTLVAIGLGMLLVGLGARPAVPSFAPASMPGRLYGKELLNTGPYNADCQQKFMTWTNTMGREIYVRKVQVWMGGSFGARMDQWFYLTDGDTMPMGDTNYDRYQEPAGFTNLSLDYTPDYVFLPSGGKVNLRYGACPVDGGKGYQGHVVVTAWWLR